MESCYNCVHKYDSDEFGLSVCGQTMRLVSIRGFTNEESQVGRAFAHDCNKYELNTTAASVEDLNRMQALRDDAQEMVVYVSTARFAGKAEKVRQTGERVERCDSCAHFIRSEDAFDFWGIRTPVCGARGLALKHNKLGLIAEKCNEAERFSHYYANQSPGDRSIANAKALDDLVPAEYKPEAAEKVVEVASLQGPRHHFSIDPRQWQTERPVTAEDEAMGIKAWRKFTDPKGKGADIFAPILDWQALGLPDPRTTFGKSKPEIYVDHGGLLYRIACLSFGAFNPGAGLQMTPALLGEAGTGKTEAYIALAYLLDAPFTRIQFTSESDRFDLEGSLQVRGGETVFQDGVLTAAYERPGILLLDEPNAAPDSLWFLLRPVLDAMGQFVIASSETTDPATGKKVGGRVVRKHPLTTIGAAMNPPDFKYRGARELSQADWERLSVLRLDLPDEAIERQIIELQLDAEGIQITFGKLDALMGIAKELRQLYDDGGLEIPWGIRQNVRIAKLLVAFTLQDAFRIGCTSRLARETEALILSIVNKYDFPG